MTFEQVRNLGLASDAARVNLLVNGSMGIAQRGAGPFTANNAYAGDRWQINLGGSSTLSVSAGQAVSIGQGGAGVYGMNGSAVINAGATSYLSQSIKFPELGQLRGGYASVSMRTYTNVGSALRLRLFVDGTGGTPAFSTYHAGGNVTQVLTATVYVPIDATQLNVNVVFDATCTFAVAMAMLAPGSVPADFVPLHPADELARCLRYYEIPLVGQTAIFQQFPNGASLNNYWYVGYKAQKAVSPTVTKVGTWQLTNLAQPSIYGAGDLNGTTLMAVNTAAGNAVAQGPAAGSSLTSEANP